VRAFKITLRNEPGYILETVVIKALDGTRALLKYIEDTAPIIEDGDKIEIQEIEE